MFALPRFLAVIAISFATALSGGVSAQIAQQRTWPELKDAVQDRVNRNAYPMTGYDREEVREVLSRINSLDRDEWARSWVQQGDKHFTHARLNETESHCRRAKPIWRRGVISVLARGRRKIPRASARPTGARPRRFALTRVSPSRRSRWYAFRLRARKSSLTCNCRLPPRLEKVKRPESRHRW